MEDKGDKTAEGEKRCASGTMIGGAGDGNGVRDFDEEGSEMDG